MDGSKINHELTPSSKVRKSSNFISQNNDSLRDSPTSYYRLFKMNPEIQNIANYTTPKPIKSEVLYMQSSKFLI